MCSIFNTELFSTLRTPWNGLPGYYFISTRLTETMAASGLNWISQQQLAAGAHKALMVVFAVLERLLRDLKSRHFFFSHTHMHITSYPAALTRHPHPHGLGLKLLPNWTGPDVKLSSSTHVPAFACTAIQDRTIHNSVNTCIDRQ